MKKTITLILCLTLALGCCAPALASGAPGLAGFGRVLSYTPGQFTDVDEGQWYGTTQEGAVKAAYELGLMVGDGAVFNPEGNVSIAETLTMAARIHSYYHTGKAEFDEGEPWYQVYADYCVAAGFVGELGQYGDLDDTEATRSQYGRIFADALPGEAYATINNVEFGAIPDVPVESGGGDYAYLLYRAGIMEGKDGGAYHPTEPISRAESAALISRIALPELRRHFTLKAPVVEPDPMKVLAEAIMFARQACNSAELNLKAAGESHAAALLAADPADAALYKAACLSYIGKSYEMTLLCRQRTMELVDKAEGEIKSNLESAVLHVTEAAKLLEALYAAYQASYTLTSDDLKPSTEYLYNTSVYLVRAYDEAAK